MNGAQPAAPTLVIWALSDGRAGHVNQTRGLVNALGAIRSSEVHWIDAPRPARALMHFAMSRFPAGEHPPRPDLVIGAGHRTHLALLAARRATGARAVVLMRPTLPARCFDLCVVPEHDGVTGENIVVTRGALNAVVPGVTKDAHAGLLLIGGPSGHSGWNTSAVVQAVRDIAQCDSGMQWTLTTSRRTPADSVRALVALDLANLRVVPFEDTDQQWLPRQLAAASRAWVTADSVSMVYEALTARALVGLIPVPRQATHRVARAMDMLVRDRLVTPLDWYRAGHAMFVLGVPFNESERVARVILSRWFRA